MTEELVCLFTAPLLPSISLLTVSEALTATGHDPDSSGQLLI